jgi:multidrug resistance efflux pump
MHERAVEAAQSQDQAFRQYVQQAAGTSGNGRSTADELSRLADLKDRGVISDEEFERLKAKAVSQ